MTRGGDWLFLCSAASRAGIGPFARCCAGRRGGHFAFVPGVLGLILNRVTVGVVALVPVVVVVFAPLGVPSMTRGGDCLCLCSSANRAGIGLFAIRCAGRRGGHFAFVPGVGGFVALRLAAAIHFPVFIGISLPIAQLAGVIIGVLLAVLEGCRACSIADARLVVHRLSRAGRIGHPIITTHILLIVDAGGYILLIAAETLMEVACIISLPRGGVAVLGFSALLPAFALVPVLAIICLPVAGIAVGGFATLLPAFALVPVLAITCFPLVGIGMVGFTALCSAFALVPVFSAVCLPVGRIGVLGYILFVPADGAFLPVVSHVIFGAVVMLAGEEFDFSIISFGDDTDGAVISVGEIGRLGSAGAALRDFHSASIIRLRGRGHDDRCGGGLAKVVGEAEVRPGGEKHIVFRAGGQIAAFIRWVVVLVAAEVHAAGKGDF